LRSFEDSSIDRIRRTFRSSLALRYLVWSRFIDSVGDESKDENHGSACLRLSSRDAVPVARSGGTCDWIAGAFPVTNPLTDLKPSSMSGLFTTVEIRGSLATSQLASIRLRTDGDDGRGADTSTQPIPLELAGQKRSARGLESGANNGCAEAVLLRRTASEIRQESCQRVQASPEKC